MKPSVLVVDNDAGMVTTLARHLDGDGFRVTSVTTGEDALRALGRETFEVVLTDLVMDRIDGLAILKDTRHRDPRPRVILMTAFGSLETAIEAMREGAFDYLTKPFRLAQVTVAVRRAADDFRLREENRRLRQQVERLYGMDQLVGRSAAMKVVGEQVRAIAPSDATVLLLGESGTGKEVVARVIHGNSARRDGPFVAVNCAAIPEALLESELFGHVKGAFTGADRARAGLFADATGGTLFLDEIADMPLSLQAKLLRALQDKLVRPVGGSEEVRLDLRLISATNRDVMALVRDGRFREDLYYRLAVIPIRLPSLRERTEDIPLLARHFLTRAAAALGKTLEGFTDEALAWLVAHRWPGNVRELENMVERAATLARGTVVGLADLGIDWSPATPAAGGLRPTLAELEDRYIDEILAETQGDKGRAARILGVSIRTLQRRSRRAP
jgi:DNA-binding NtrC family response regulator